MSKRWQQADRKLRAAEAAYAREAKSACQINGHVEWMHGEHRRSGMVVRHSGGHGFMFRVQVISARSGKCEWVYACRILDCAAPRGGKGGA